MHHKIQTSVILYNATKPTLHRGKGTNSVADVSSAPNMSRPKKQAAPPTQRHYSTLPLLQGSLALQETLAKPGTSQQPENNNKENPSKNQHLNGPTKRNNILDLVITILDLRIIGLEVTDKSLITITQVLNKKPSSTTNGQTSN
ncbi:hypothetical protein FHG87_017097 [Trinorchestia longiramus]|nr:hypothetical protein FHG87_017097 [Trinorchestia longiramus]